MKKRSGNVYIGTSNIVVPGNKQSFPVEYQQKSRLNYYSSIFNSLEINSSFYKVPMRATFEKWPLDVPEHFKFTIKLWRDITHAKNLVFDLHYIDSFLKAANGLGHKKGCLLVQFPGKITMEYYSQVEQIVARIHEQDTLNEWRTAIEFRSPTWYVSETHELLDEYNASLVLHDIPKAKNTEANKNASFINIRFHGPTGTYRGSYSDEFLQQQYQQIKAWASSGKDVFAYFNNTMGSAFENAQTLKAMVNK